MWLLDEVSAVTGWSAIVKVDAGRDSRQVTTPSSPPAAGGSPDEDIEGNLMAGRAGSGPGRRRRLLLPMSFRDFLAATPSGRPAGAVPPRRRAAGAGRLAALAALEFDVRRLRPGLAGLPPRAAGFPVRLPSTPGPVSVASVRTGPGCLATP